jgi:hypothetical protein
MDLLIRGELRHNFLLKELADRYIFLAKATLWNYPALRFA